MVICPKCKAKGNRIVINEIYENYIEFEQYDDGSIDSVGALMHGNVLRVEAICSSCSHSWKLRKSSQITEVQEAYNGNNALL